MASVIVAGDGVAGMTAARWLQLQGVAVTLIAQSGKIISRGETLSPRALPFLQRLGWDTLLTPSRALANEGRFSVWGDDKLRKADLSGEGTSYHIDRAALEMQMAKGLASVERCHSSIQSIRHEPEGVTLRLANGEIHRATVLIDCSGRAALSSGDRANRRRLDRLVALWRVLPVAADVDMAPVTLVEATPSGWCYSAPMPGQRLILAAFTDTDLVPSGAGRTARPWKALLAAAPATLQRLASLATDLDDLPPSLAAASTVICERLLEGRIIRAGDAAAAFDPLAANGLVTAFWSGMQAADAAIALLSGDETAAQRYEAAFLDGLATTLMTGQSLYANERRFNDQPFWARRH